MVLVEEIFKDLAFRLGGLAFVTDNYGLCERKKTGDKKEVPVWYDANGKVQEVEFNKGGVVYFRVLEGMKFGESKLRLVSCGGLTDASMKVRVVSVVRRDFLPVPAAMTAYALVQELSRVVMDWSGFALPTGVVSMGAALGSSEVSSVKVLAGETSGLDITDFEYNRAAVWIDAELRWTFDANCVGSICKEEDAEPEE